MCSLYLLYLLHLFPMLFLHHPNTISLLFHFLHIYLLLLHLLLHLHLLLCYLLYLLYLVWILLGLFYLLCLLYYLHSFLVLLLHFLYMHILFCFLLFLFHFYSLPSLLHLSYIVKWTRLLYFLGYLLLHFHLSMYLELI